MKFRAHETFFLRKGWLNKGLKQVKIKADVFTDKEENPMDVFGIGSNMVKSLRYWLQATGLTKENTSGKRFQQFTELGEIIYSNDKYLEELGTLFLLHYKLVTNKEEATSWYYFFNIFNQLDFNKDEFVNEINKYISIEGNDVALRSLNDDFNCIINTYISRVKLNLGKVSAENNIDSPFGELALINISTRGKNYRYKKSLVKAGAIDPWVALAVIVEEAKGETSIQLNHLLNNPCNIGKVFNLDAISMLELLHSIEKIGKIKIIRTAGLDVVIINEKLSFLECVENYYKRIK
ncbi:DUF4007 domain-containing protein [Fusobacterium nucleatum subsp. nucleatum ATCC 25586]|uniref:DUF4007 domain-containing protein n=1 Tax=Fusobacterium nucleatum subsp. nucleatum (strain ATCC 25586 / DSM 15643 / BCRC 10681 / CIP 101130 / JCM 8532 / KCTC 2640 / LMG 13131 / VPI 4355) TaxID=190304 RepID=Q8RG72_FUSNN|nr:DUF4007 family protein [Fusobacterium nucleatum]AAL94641.1 Hypothetical protein FN0445 [Fusobacterium nucleatum subsp. nucleatum ATCC 25586]AVQ14902.1 DUF4007 domain-containing protein [Fusobacterium nucleatum subsp. nucleatum ATCC 25586]WMS29755.1 DUF4007 family protein [Fusobacterium nucleatum]